MARKSSDNAADAAAPIDAAVSATVDSAADAAEDNTPSMLESITDAAQAAAADAAPATVEPLADGTVELSPVAQVQALIAKLDAALPALAGTPMETALLAQRADLIGALALAEADAALIAERDAAETQARQVALENGLPAEMLAAMLRAVDEKYAPAPMPAEAAAPAPEIGGKKQVGHVASERNATVAAALAEDMSPLAQRADAAIAAWFGSADDIACATHKAAGTRYAGLVALGSAGAGVANRADYVTLATAIRIRLEATLPIGGQTAPDSPWLAALGIYPYDAKRNGKDSLPLCFTDRREVALYPDGRFRLALPAQAGMRYIHSDAGAYATFGSGKTAAASPASPATVTAPAAPVTPRIPTAPAVAAAPNGQLAATARCSKCSAKNFVTDAACRACATTDWRIA